MPATDSAQAADIRQQLHEELESTRQDFHLLLDEIHEEDYDLPSLNLAWTIREVLYHMSLAPRNLPSDVRLIRHLKWVPKLPAGPFNSINAYLTRRGARNLDKAALAAKYDEAHSRTILALDSVKDDQWAFGVDYPDWDPILSGFVTLERLFHYIRQHFEAHAEEIRSALSSKY
jgi:hypothetical protein